MSAVELRREVRISTADTDESTPTVVIQHGRIDFAADDQARYLLRVAGGDILAWLSLDDLVQLRQRLGEFIEQEAEAARWDVSGVRDPWMEEQAGDPPV